ncbi:substrate-binding domain-containing protein [Microbaculum sp. A6E488]|uniref:Substrate-binding domain-containing protein n=1 Tax=Microbaculum marinisediminis TaxID=2931392 RepID=A0AAW5R6C9_9HYPH|nr:substrate-binding domain-containing protein [Microbaculum sp. A6E488]
MSVATVSRALKKPETVALHTRERILALVAQHRYVPDTLATSFSSGKTGLIGLIVPTIANSIYAAFTVAIQARLQAEGRKLLIANSNYDTALERDILIKLVESRVEGVILTGFRRDAELYELLRHYRIPFVVTWSTSPDPDIPAVSFDNEAAAELAVEALIERGHRNIAIVCGITAINDRADQRLKAYRRTLDRHGLPFNPDYVQERLFEFREGERAAEVLLQREPRPTALFCANDILALGALFAATRQGVRVPHDLSIIGFDDLPIAQSVYPTLSTVHVPAQEMGEAAAMKIVNCIEKNKKITHLRLESRVVFRESTDFHLKRDS